MLIYSAILEGGDDYLGDGDYMAHHCYSNVNVYYKDLVAMSITKI